MVKCPGPVRADCKRVNAVFLHIFHLLPRMVFHNHFIRKPGLPDMLYPLVQGIHDIQFSAGFIILFRRYADNQIIP